MPRLSFLTADKNLRQKQRLDSHLRSAGGFYAFAADDLPPAARGAPTGQMYLPADPASGIPDAPPDGA